MTKENQEPGEGQENKTKADDIAAGFGEDLKRWCLRAGIGKPDKKFTCYLHRILDDKSQRFLCSYKNEFPDLDDFALKYGGGKFNIHVETYNKGEKQGSGEVFYIDDVWNEIREEKNKQGAQQAAVSPGMADASQIVSLVEKLVRVTTEARKPQSDLMSISRLVNTFAEDQFRANMKLIGQTRRRLLENALEGDFEEVPTLPVPDQENPLVGVVIGLIEQYAPKILGGGPAGEAIVNAVKAAIQKPEFQTLTNDPAAMRKIIGSVNKRYGPDETRRLFGLIGFKL